MQVALLWPIPALRAENSMPSPTPNLKLLARERVEQAVSPAPLRSRFVEHALNANAFNLVDDNLIEPLLRRYIKPLTVRTFPDFNCTAFLPTVGPQDNFPFGDSKLFRDKILQTLDANAAKENVFGAVGRASI